MTNQLASVVIIVLSGCTHLTTNTSVDWNYYYPLMVRRVDEWFKGDAPKLPTIEYMQDRTLTIEKPITSTYQGEHTCWCTHTLTNVVVRIPVDLWDSGCVPHELGHGALRLIDHSCWRDFEHIPYKDAECNE